MNRALAWHRTTSSTMEETLSSQLIKTFNLMMPLRDALIQILSGK